MPHLQCALNALAVARCQAGGGGGVYLGQLGVHAGPANGLGLGFELGAHFGVGGGHVVNAVQQRLEVQHGAAHQQGQCTTGADLGNEARGVLHKLGSAVGLQRVADVDEVVGHGSALCRCGFGGANVHAAVHQGRIDADDLHRHAPPQHGGQGQRPGGFARCGGACQRNVGQVFRQHVAVLQIFVPRSRTWRPAPPTRRARPAPGAIRCH